MAQLDEGSPEPLGVTLIAGGANVAVWSANATAIEICLFDRLGATEQARIRLPARTGDVFHGLVPGIGVGSRYGLRAHGPWLPQEGHRFNAAKLLVDPYAVALDRPFALHASQFDGATPHQDDSAPFVPKAIVQHPPPTARTLQPGVPWNETILYELHVKGFTQRHPRVPERIRGTVAGLAHPRAIEHLVRLGITTVELMPVAAWADERHLPALGLANYWGYNPVAFLAPDARLCPGGLADLAACVSALHDAGIEVLLDVVFNHTAESDALGPTLSLRGLDNASYYRLAPHDKAHYVNDTGCGNTLALDRPPAMRLVLDALRHFVRHAGVDGFRFDLATTLGRRESGFDPDAPLLHAIAQDPLLRDRKLIAEPWDIGPGGHQLGAFPAAWGEWNDRYRDTARRFWRGDAHQLGELATRLAGSSDVLGPRSRSPSRSVNLITAHDGFTLADLVSHAGKHNAANGEGNRDGTDHNLSWNHGVEGPSDDEALRAARARDTRALLATLFSSRGTPLLSMGDELGRSQAGNNNAYAQDNALSWIDWEKADQSLIDFTASLIRLRRSHPALREDRWLTGEPRDASGLPDIEWLTPEGIPLEGEAWERYDARALVASLYSRAHGEQTPDRVLVAINGMDAPMAMQWPEPRDGFAWTRLADSASPAHIATQSTEVAGRSVAILAETPAPRRQSSGIEPRWLARLASAAGIAPTWHDVSGREHRVSDDTRHALLAGMRLDARTTNQARERLHAMARERERRLLPQSLVVRPTGGRLPIASLPELSDHATLNITGADGHETRVAVDLRGSPMDSVRAADGGRAERRLIPLPPLGIGRYHLALEGHSARTHLIVAPPACHLPETLARRARSFGLAAHLYSLRRAGDQGVGDFTTLAEALSATARAGGSVVGVNPLHALFPDDRERASPYHPSDRRRLDPIYVDLAAIQDFHDSPQAQQALSRRAVQLERLTSRSHVDYPAAWALKREILLECHRRFQQRDTNDPSVQDYRQFVHEAGSALRQFVAFTCLSANHAGMPWWQWPEPSRRPTPATLTQAAESNLALAEFTRYTQWLADRQLQHAASVGFDAGLGVGLYRDLAVGAAPDGAEAWAVQDALAQSVSVGAPPDPFSPEGQVWGLPPLLPRSLHATGYTHFEQLLAANMRHAGALRIDHVMGLQRLFWVPQGASAAEGAYVAYPFDELLGVLQLESHRTRCLVVGEDLGTVPEGFRDRLAEAQVLSYRVFWFERGDTGWRRPEDYPTLAAACVSTHDLPTIAGWWQGADLDEQASLHPLRPEAAAAERRARELARQQLAQQQAEWGCLRPAGDAQPTAVAIASALHRTLARTPCALRLVQADDLDGAVEALNVPGTDRERPNWRRRLSVDTNEIWETLLGHDARLALATETREKGSG